MTAFTNKEINLEELPDYERVSMNSISPKQLTKVLIQLGIFSIFLFGGWLFLYYGLVLPVLSTVLGIFFVLLIAFIAFTLIKKQPRYGYALREEDLIYERGYLIDQVTVVPFVRIQHVSISRGFLEKSLGLARLKVFTAGGSGSDLSIPGLQPKLAEQLKETIANQIKDDLH